MNLESAIQEMRGQSAFASLFDESASSEKRSRNGAMVRAIAVQRLATAENRSLKASEQRTFDAAVASVRSADATRPALSPAMLLALISGDI